MATDINGFFTPADAPINPEDGQVYLSNTGSEYMYDAKVGKWFKLYASTNVTVNRTFSYKWFLLLLLIPAFYLGKKMFKKKYKK